MFEKETVFILGAGASWHYGYPTGEELVKKVIEATNFIEKHLNQKRRSAFYGDFTPDFIAKAFPNTQNDIVESTKSLLDVCENIRNKLIIINPPVIDYFLRDNPALQMIGKFLIAMVIKDCEYKSLKEGNINKPTDDRKKANDHWLRFIIYQLLAPRHNNPLDTENIGHHLCENKVSFITFNYDTSLEYKIYQSLSNTEVINSDICNGFINEDRFIHIYGKVNSNDRSTIESTNTVSTYNLWEQFNKDSWSEGTSNKMRTNKVFLDYCYDLATTKDKNKGIKTIGGINGEKHDNEVAINNAKRKIEAAKTVYILGYGFDKQNNELLELGGLLNYTKEKRILFTNFGNHERINKKAGKLFFDDYNAFSGNKLVKTHEDEDYYYEKSIKNVYDAFAYDFDAI